jgi:hypothetical protein
MEKKPVAKKRCVHCGLEMPVTEFAKVPKSVSPDGRSKYCKWCIKRPLHYRMLKIKLERRSYKNGK